MKLLTRSAAVLTTALLVAPLVSQTGAAFSDYSKPQHATVSILALSTAQHNGYSGSQDVYFATLRTKKGEEAFVKLVDIYEGYGYPIRRSLLQNRQTLNMDVVRQTDCDMVGRDLFLPPDAQIYDASVPDSLRTHAGDVVPCYRTIHRTIKVAKKP